MRDDPQVTHPSGPDYLSRARELGPRLAAAAEEIERRRELPEAILDALVANIERLRRNEAPVNRVA